MLRVSHEQIDKTQVRVKDHTNLHVHPYDPKVLEKVRQDMFQQRTCKEFIDWLDTHPHYDMVAEASSQYIRGSDRDEVVWNCAEIQTDWKAIMEKVSSYAKEKNVDKNFNTDYTTEWRINDMK